ncbi:hypothetical protein V1478_001971 [Vespula squamosa]|uniref:Uncharacterized protein n=1 Tax=Vespula squamosa TaxID=30214 RepID=A0ABD2BYN2_VESSQ
MCTSSQRTKALTVIGGFLGATSTNHKGVYLSGERHDYSCHLYQCHASRLQIVICGKKFPRSQYLTFSKKGRANQLLVPPLPISCDPLTNSDLRKGISTQPIICTSSQRTKALPGIGGFLGATSTNHVRSLRILFRRTTRLLVPPLPMSCVPLTNCDLREEISAKPIPYLF